MKTIAAILLLSCCAFGQDKAAISAAEAGCGPQDAVFEVTPDDARHLTAAPESDKALIYVVERAQGIMRFGADGKWIGALKPGTYFFTSLNAGEHHLCVSGHLALWKGLSLHSLNAKAGETYYFLVRVLGGGYNELSLSELDPDEGKDLVARSKLSDSRPK